MTFDPLTLVALIEGFNVEILGIQYPIKQKWVLKVEGEDIAITSCI